MAAGFASFTVFCFLCFSTLSTADLPAIDKTIHDLLPESNTKSDEADTIFLPTERLESDESAPVIESQPGISGSEIAKPESEVETLKPTESSQASDSVPITMITFRPLNRYMPWRPMQFPSRPRHPCHHNHKFRPWNPRIPRRQIPYGNDMILSNGDEKSFRVLPDDRVPKIPMRWTRFGRFDPSFTEEPGMARSEEVLMRPHHHHHHHDHDDHDHEHEHHDHDDHDHEHERDDDHDHEHDHHHDHDDHDHEHEHDDTHDHKHAHHHDHDDHDHERDHHHDHHDYSFYERDHEDGGLMSSIRKFLQHF